MAGIMGARISSPTLSGWGGGNFTLDSIHLHEQTDSMGSAEGILRTVWRDSLGWRKRVEKRDSKLSRAQSRNGSVHVRREEGQNGSFYEYSRFDEIVYYSSLFIDI
jgi:hypothetical protein